ncbi:MAG: hypothetical protein ACE5RC_07530, partial [Nitrosopumilus sp.]
MDTKKWTERKDDVVHKMLGYFNNLDGCDNKQFVRIIFIFFIFIFTSMEQELKNSIDENKIHNFMNKAVQDIASSSTAMLVILGERLGLYKAMAEENKYITFQELAKKTGTNERLIKEWLGNQVASGYIQYDPSTE